MTPLSHVELVAGGEARALLSIPEFRRAWSALRAVCPWATAIQDEPFATAWYDAYRAEYEPLLVRGMDERGELVALLALARAATGGRLVVVGAHQAEYQAWLARPEVGDGFIVRALDLLARHAPRATLRFTYLPPGTPVGWLDASPRWRSRARTRTYSRPLMMVGDGSVFRADLARRKYRVRLRALERIGPLAFERVTDPAAFERIVDEIGALHDLRQGTANGIWPFRDDRCKRDFHLALMRVPGLLHVTVLRADERILSAQIHLRDERLLISGILAHAPVAARHSPGWLHIMMLGAHLADEGVPAFDLTPGGEDHKERFATNHDEVHGLTISLGRWRAVTERGSWRARTVLKQFVGAFGIEPAAIRRLPGRIGRALLGNVVVSAALGRLGERYRRGRGATRYVFENDREISVDRTLLVRDSLPDLVACVRGHRSRRLRAALLRDVIPRLEADLPVFSTRAGDSSPACGWIEAPIEATGEPHRHGSSRAGVLVSHPAPSMLLASPVGAARFAALLVAARATTGRERLVVEIPGTAGPAHVAAERLGLTRIDSSIDQGRAAVGHSSDARTRWAATSAVILALLACDSGTSDPDAASHEAVVPRTAAIVPSTPVSLVALPRSVEGLRLDTVAAGLEVPWALAFVPDGRILVVERAGRIRVVENGVLRETPWATLDVFANEPELLPESGLLGIAPAPDFATSGHVYVVGTFAKSGTAESRRLGPRLWRRLVGLVSPIAASPWENRVYRLTDRDGQGVDPELVIDDLPASYYHAGSALAFGPDGRLYLTTGDVLAPDEAADEGSLAGKILRYEPDGRVPIDNPFPGSPVFALGFRNSQGIAWHPETGDLFAIDHGPTGMTQEQGRMGDDELNVVERGGNYGWPAATGESGSAPLRRPVAVWPTAIAPAGMAVYTGRAYPWYGDVIVGGLRGRTIRRVALERDARGPSGWAAAGEEVLFSGDLGRIRAVAMSPDGHIYVTTSDRDGRGIPGAGGDFLLRLAGGG